MGGARYRARCFVTVRGIDMAEEWRPVVGHEGRFEVSNRGNVRSLDRSVTYSDGRKAVFKGHVLTALRGKGGHMAVNLSDGDRALIRDLVAEAFIAPPDGACVPKHKNGDKRDNRVENLQWSDQTHSRNDAVETELVTQRQVNGTLPRYSDQLVAAIRRVHAHFDCSIRELSRLFDISETQAADIVKGKARLPHDMRTDEFAD
jgi:hypothetical protein